MYQKYTIQTNTELTETRLSQILQQFQTQDLPKLKRLKNYYTGKHDIVYKQPVDQGRPNNKIIINFCKNIVDTYLGYLVGKPITFLGENTEEIMKVLDYNDSNATFSEYLRQSLIYGRSFLITYLDEESKQRLQVFDSQECIPVYSDTIEGQLEYVIRFWQDNSKGTLETDTIYRVEVYGPDSVKRYTSAPGFETFTLEDIDDPNFYSQCQVTVFSLNAEEEGIFKQVISINDAINELASGSIDSYEDFANSYLVLQGMTADKDDLDSMKKNRCILLDGDEHCNAFFLTKNVSDAQVKDSLELLTNRLFTISQCPDFTDPQFFGSANSGVALSYKLIGFENACADIELQMRKAIQRIIELISTIISFTDESIWRDIRILFRRNLPVNLSEIINLVSSLRGIVSQETLLSQLPFIDDPLEEMEKIKKEREEESALYNPQITEEYIDE